MKESSFYYFIVSLINRLGFVRQNIISYNKDKNLIQNISLSDPCSNTFEHDILTDDGFRSPACRRSHSEPRCDDNLVEGWYVLHSSDGSTTLRVHRECPRQSTCGTDNPIWMNGGLQTKRYCHVILNILYDYVDTCIVQKHLIFTQKDLTQHCITFITLSLFFEHYF